MKLMPNKVSRWLCMKVGKGWHEAKVTPMDWMKVTYYDPGACFVRAGANSDASDAE
jgi:hypothetical protein